MKKKLVVRNICIVAATMLLMLFALPERVHAVDYDLWIAGVQVTSENCGDLSVIDGVEGTVKYSASSKTLSLTNATITNLYVKAIESKISGLIIRVSGVNKLNSGGAAGVTFAYSATISGDGHLRISSEHMGIYVGENVTLTIKDCLVSAKGRWGIAG